VENQLWGWAKPQIKEAWLSRGESWPGKRRYKKEKWDTSGQAVPGAVISKLEQATRRGAFQECIQQREKQQALQENGSGWLQLCHASKHLLKGCCILIWSSRGALGGPHAATRWIDHRVAICRAAQWRMGRALFLDRKPVQVACCRGHEAAEGLGNRAAGFGSKKPHGAVCSAPVFLVHTR